MNDAVNKNAASSIDSAMFNIKIFYSTSNFNKLIIKLKLKVSSESHLASALLFSLLFK